MTDQTGNPGAPEDPARVSTASESEKERRLAVRYALVLAAEFADLTHEAWVEGRTSDISLEGCYIDTPNPISQGQRIRVHLKNGPEAFESIAVVAYSHEGLGMGVAFRETEPLQLEILQKWVSNEAGRR